LRPVDPSPAIPPALSQALRRYAPWGFFVVALIVRTWRLSDQSFWFDEAMSLYWARRSPGDILRVGLALEQDPHPPVYYLLLHYLIGVLGESEVAVRSLSVLAGALLVFPMYGLGHRLGHRATGLVVALLVALNPFLVWYGQEARMYALAVTLGMTGLYAFLRVLDEGRLRWAVAAAVVMLAALYTYLLSAVLLPVAAFWWLIGGRLRQSEPLSTPLPSSSPRFGERKGAKGRAERSIGLLTLAAIALGFAPLAWRAWLATATPAVLPGGAPPGTLAVLGGWLTTWTIHKATWGPLVPWIVVALALSGLAVASGRARWYLAGFLFLPLATALILGRRDLLVLAETRYFIAIVPALLLTVATFLGWLSGRQCLVGLLAVLLVAGATIMALGENWQPQHRREDWREAARYVMQHGRPGDAILIHVDYVSIAFRQYYRGSLPLFFPFHDRLSDFAQVALPLEGMAGYDTIWLIQSHTATFDPDGLVERWLSEHHPLLTEQYPAGVVVKGYAVRIRYPALPPDVRPLDAEFGASLRLAGCRLADTRLRARDDRSHPPSGWVHVTLYWQASEPLTQDYMPVVRLVDSGGQIWGDRLDRAASIVRRFPPSRWPVSEFVRDEQDVNLNPLTPPGRYRIVVGLVDGAGQQVAASGADTIAAQAICGEVEIVH
jgi:mannosyltransferase